MLLSKQLQAFPFNNTKPQGQINLDWQTEVFVKIKGYSIPHVPPQLNLWTVIKNYLIICIINLLSVLGAYNINDLFINMCMSTLLAMFIKTKLLLVQ